ncbi:MAG: metallophosphoesterase family protein [Planctomycetes bacterium]|nr:metallophosphoesterase family protein [Planctomycetota bacterium]
MRFAVISDLHSNIVALRAVFEDIDRRGIDTIYCLGDVVGYGPDPEPCIDLVRERCAFTVRGNHDEALFSGADRFNPYARGAILWTRDRLRPGLFRPRINNERWEWLQSLPLEQRVGDHWFVHGSPRDHVNEYIYREDVFFNADGKLKTIFAGVKKTLFVGHTHLPVVIGDDLKTFVPSGQEATCNLTDRKFIVNVGSVGQPRDRDPRACYVEWNEPRLTYHRIAYDVDSVVKRIKKLDALDPILGTRLLDGM